MRLASLVSLTLAVALAAGCGARTGEDELLTVDLTAVGGAAVGGSGGSGGFFTGGSSSGGNSPSPCCQISGGVGCPLDEAIESCVCAADSFCCEGAWDAECVTGVQKFGCGTCSVGSGGAGGTGGSGGGPPAACCEIQDAAGCVDPALESCVCEIDRFCCATAWDAQCVDEVGLCGPSCTSGGGGSGGIGGTGGMPNTGGTGGTGGIGNCCSMHSEPSCSNPDIWTCVCAGDPFCCETAWDGICLEGVEACGIDCPDGSGGAGGSGGTGGTGGGPNVGGTGGFSGSGGFGGTGGFSGSGGFGGTGGFNTGGAGGAPGTGGLPGTGGFGGMGTVDGQTCCQEQEFPSCSQPAVRDCVCALDSFCCQFSWDDICVDEATAQCGASCDSPECAYFQPGSCESCACDSCHDSLLACTADAACSCVFYTGCSTLLECAALCGSAVTPATLGLLNQLSNCEQISGCGCQ